MMISTMTRRIQLRIKLLVHSPNTCAPGATLGHITQEKTILAPEVIILRTTKTLLRQDPNRRTRKAGKIALMNKSYSETRRIVIISHSPRKRRASATRNSLCLRNLSSRNALNAG